MPTEHKNRSYASVLTGMVELLRSARYATARTINSFMAATYWEIGRRIVEFEQAGARRAEYGSGILARLALDLTARFGRGFGVDNLELMRRFFLAYPSDMLRRRLAGISETLSRKSTRRLNSEMLSRNLGAAEISAAFPLPWSHYSLLIRRSRSAEARAFYEEAALRGGWSVRTLDRQMSTLYFERTTLSRDKAKMLSKHAKPHPGELLSPIEAVRDPLILEFLDLKDDYSESDLEEALVRHLQKFLLELGDDWAFVDRQRRLRLDSQWYRVDLLFYHRVLRCLVVIDLKLGKFTHADAGQMHLYLNYARENWTRKGENPPVGLILCSTTESDVVRYALDGLPNRIMAAEARLKLPDEKRLLRELRQSRQEWELQQRLRSRGKKKHP